MTHITEPDADGMMLRTPLDPELSIKAAIIILSEGNPGAINVLCQWIVAGMKPEDISELLHKLDAMNMRGRQIFGAFKYGSNGDMTTFTENVRNMSAAMCDAVNARYVCSVPGRKFQEYAAPPSLTGLGTG